MPTSQLSIYFFARAAVIVLVTPLMARPLFNRIVRDRGATRRPAPTT